ncbi:prolyl oligopeptidase family serine peptidase, partial [Serratia marcescens]|uniref:prolyl oligopeptidase family serine peptidase n=1 Tax=Serratia marcescens TaxID=615 RepID=UPI000DA10152
RPRTWFPSPGCDTSSLVGGAVAPKLAAVADNPLLLWHGVADDVVPPGDTFRLQQALTQSGLATNLTCHWQKGVRHRITPEALHATTAFFLRHL